MAQPRRILFKSGAQALVGNVDKRRETLRFGPVPQRLPLRRGQVRAAGVVAAAVEQHQVAAARRLEVLEHGLEIHSASRRVVVAIGFKGQADAAEQGHVHRPTRIRDPNPGAGRRRLRNLGADTQRAATAGGLNTAHARVLQRGAVGAENQALHPRIESGHAGGRQVGLAGLLGQQRGLGLTHGAKHRADTVFIHVNPHREVHLVRAGIGAAGRRQAEDGVVGKSGKHIEHGKQSG